MRVYRYVSPERDEVPRIAVAASPEAPVDLADAWGNAFGSGCPSSVLGLIEGGPRVWAAAADAAGRGGNHAVDAGRPGFRWLCPLDRLASLRDFLAFEDHVRRGALRRNAPVPEYWYEAPVYYKGNHRSVIGPGEPCPWPSYTERLDFELELAMIVGRRGRDVQPDAAAAYVFGFTIMNDFSARDVQAREMSAWLGPAKGKDFATALGPCIVTADELGAQPDLAMICRVNGEEWGRARSSQVHWTWAEMLAHVSRDEDVFPGDVYGSGTPGGCCGLDAGRALDPGDVVDLEIERIGTLRNPIGGRQG